MTLAGPSIEKFARANGRGGWLRGTLRSARLAVPVGCETVTLAPAACNRWTTCCSEPQPAQALLPTASAGGAGPDSTGASGVSPDHLIT